MAKNARKNPVYIVFEPNCLASALKKGGKKRMYFDDFIELPKTKQPDTPLLRTVKDTAAMIKQSDPHSGITEYFIRCLARAGKIRTLTVGKKVLVYWKSLVNFLELHKGV